MVVATEKFADLARQSASRSGIPDARIVAVAHPVGGIPAAELLQRADASVDAVLACWVAR